MESPQLQSIIVFDISVMAHRQIPMVVEFLQLQYIDKMFDVRCAGPASSGSGRENTVEFPQLQPVSWTWSFTRPLCATTVAQWSMSSCSSSTWVDVAVMLQRPVPAVGLNSWNEG